MTERRSRPHIVQKDGHDGGIHIEITEGVAKWLSIVLALMFLGAIFVAGEGLSQAANARADAAAARERAQTAQEDATRSLRQADLSNWIIMNLEDIMRAHGVAVPENLRPRNLPRATGQ